MLGKISNATGAESSTASTVDYEPFFKAASGGDLRAVKDFIFHHHEAVSATVPITGKTALHIAADGGNMQLVEELVPLMSESDLAIQQSDGMTALCIVAVVGNTRMAKCMIEKNIRLATIPDERGYIPILIAFLHDHRQLGRYLFSVTPHQELLAGGSLYAVSIITQCIYNESNFG